MFGSSVIAPVAISAVIAAGAPTLNREVSPIFPSAATVTSTFQLTSLASPDWPKFPVASAAATPLPFGLPQVLAIMTALAAFNPGAATTMQFINTELLNQLADGTPLGEAMVNVSLMLSSPGSDGPASPLAPVLNMVGPMFALAPTVIAGGMTVLAALPEAVIPVVGAVVVAAFKVAAAAGSDGFGAAVETGLYNVMTAVGKGIATIVNVVQGVLQDIAGVVGAGTASRIAAPTAAKAVRAKETRTTRATGVAAPRPGRSAPATPSAKKHSGSDRSASSGRASSKRSAQASSGKVAAKSAN